MRLMNCNFSPSIYWFIFFITHCIVSLSSPFSSYILFFRSMFYVLYGNHYVYLYTHYLYSICHTIPLKSINEILRNGKNNILSFFFAFTAQFSFLFSTFFHSHSLFSHSVSLSLSLCFLRIVKWLVSRSH